MFNIDTDNWTDAGRGDALPFYARRGLWLGLLLFAAITASGVIAINSFIRAMVES